mgnify:CR=1 FL=1
MSAGFPIAYIEPVFRPPSEAHSLILPVTNGCSWNACTFCEMYTQPQKKFRARDESQVLEEIRRAGQQLIVQRVFLADGDALVLPTRRLLNILQAIREHMPEVQRVSSYCLPRNVRNKSVADLQALREAGLSLVYVGAESGDDEVLRRRFPARMVTPADVAFPDLRDDTVRQTLLDHLERSLPPPVAAIPGGGRT